MRKSFQQHGAFSIRCRSPGHGMQCTAMGIQFHITGLNPIRHENMPTPDAEGALKSFEIGAPEFGRIIDGESGSTILTEVNRSRREKYFHSLQDIFIAPSPNRSPFPEQLRKISLNNHLETICSGIVFACKTDGYKIF